VEQTMDVKRSRIGRCDIAILGSELQEKRGGIGRYKEVELGGELGGRTIQNWAVPQCRLGR
jgi:hypothetical protein